MGFLNVRGHSRRIDFSDVGDIVSVDFPDELFPVESGIVLPKQYAKIIHGRLDYIRGPIG